MLNVSGTIIREFEELFSKISAPEKRRNQTLAECRTSIEQTLKELERLLNAQARRIVPRAPDNASHREIPPITGAVADATTTA